MKGFPFSASMMLTALLYFSICSCKNVEGNELAQQKLKPKLISHCSKCSIVSLSVGNESSKSGEGESKTSIKTWNRWQGKHQSPFVVFPSIPQAPLSWPTSTKPSSKAPVPVLGVLEPGFHHPAGQPGPAKAPYELSKAGCHTSCRVLLSFHPVLPCLHNWLRYYTPCPPCRAFSTPASLGLFVPRNSFPANSLLRWGWKCFEAETTSLHSCLFSFVDLFHT